VAYPEDGESCNGLDDNCNGETDEGCTNYYRDADRDSYGNATDSIVSITQPEGYVPDSTDCDDSKGAVNPGATEICNGIDDDCNGEIDEGYVQTPTTCGLGICASEGNMVCQSGQVIDTCANGTAQAEICDQAQLDEDCDGTANEDCDCVIGQERPCYEGPQGTEDVGICHNGTQSCDSGRWGECANVAYPEDGESCNGLDDNCNGQTDEGFGTTTCGTGICGHTISNCENGQAQECNPMQGSREETCNGLDDNCNGQTDEGNVCKNKKNEPSNIIEEPLPLNILIDSISCQSGGTGDITIEARDYRGKPLPGVLISIGGRSRTTGTGGTVFFNGLEKGEYTLFASKDGYENITADFAVSCQKREVPKLPPAQPPAEEIKTLNIIVKEMSYNNDGTANVRLLVEDYNNNSISDAAVNVSGINALYFTGKDGTVTLTNIKNGAYIATASKKGYSQDRTDFTIKFEVKKEPAGQPSQPPVAEEGKLVYSVQYCPILILLAILVIFYILWKRRKKKQQVDEAQVKEQK
jgi:hypothetical protein